VISSGARDKRKDSRARLQFLHGGSANGIQIENIEMGIH
jgi:hypothetical protein